MRKEKFLSSSRRVLRSLEKRFESMTGLSLSALTVSLAS